jgi:hypothetical protein
LKRAKTNGEIFCNLNECDFMSARILEKEKMRFLTKSNIEPNDLEEYFI